MHVNCNQLCLQEQSLGKSGPSPQGTASWHNKRLIDRKLILYSVPGAAVLRLLQSSPVPEHRMLYELNFVKLKGAYKFCTKIISNPAYVIKNIDYGKAVVMAPAHNPIRYYSKESAANLYTGYLLPKNSPLKKYINKIIRQLQAGGIISKLTENSETMVYGGRTAILKRDTERQKVQDSSTIMLTMSHFLTCFIIFGIGMPLSTLVFIVEVLKAKKKISLKLWAGS